MYQMLFSIKKNYFQELGKTFRYLLSNEHESPKSSYLLFLHLESFHNFLFVFLDNCYPTRLLTVESCKPLGS